MSDGHAYLPPSGAHAWRYCAMWPTMAGRYPVMSGAEADEGDAAHWVAAQALAGAAHPAGTRAPNGVPITDEMLDGARVWADAVGERSSDSHVEGLLCGRSIHPTANWGTPDYWDIGVSEGRSVLRIMDYKYGHEYVDAVGNWQLINYLALALEACGINGAGDQLLHVELTIVQPRAYGHPPVRTWRPGTAAQLRGEINTLRAAADRAMAPDPVASVGPYCKHCPGRHACAVLQRVALESVDYAGHAAPLDLPAQALGYELRALDRARDLLEARRTGLQAQAEARIKAGERIPHYALTRTPGREQWTLPVTDLIALAATLGVDVAKPSALTPAQARKAGMPADIVASLSARTPGEMRLTPDDGSAARRAFTQPRTHTS